MNRKYPPIEILFDLTTEDLKNHYTYGIEAAARGSGLRSELFLAIMRSF